MCTVSWAWSAEGYDLFFNRDELATRAPESSPELGGRDGVAYVAPCDGARGGTWLAANEHGVTLGLLNDYGASWRPAPAAPRASRGQVVRAGAGVKRLADVEPIVRAQPLPHTPPFHLVALSPDEGTAVWHWQGIELVRLPPAAVAPVLTSSSFATSAVIADRLNGYDRMVGRHGPPTVSRLAAYHEQHDARRGAFSVLMRRPDAATRSVIRVCVTRRRVAVEYRSAHWHPDGCVLGPARTVELPRPEGPPPVAPTGERCGTG